MRHIKKYIQINESSKITVDSILNMIDTSKMESYIYDICENQFQIYDYPDQGENSRLTYCYLHRWICTDTEVGIRVWYFDNKPVCISWKPYRKYDESYGWISKDGFVSVKSYIHSLIDNSEDNSINIIDDLTIDKIVKEFDKIDYKKGEVKNIK